MARFTILFSVHGQKLEFERNLFVENSTQKTRDTITTDNRIGAESAIFVTYARARRWRLKTDNNLFIENWWSDDRASLDSINSLHATSLWR